MFFKNNFDFISEGKIPKGAIYLGKSESMDGDVRHTDSYYAVPTEEKAPTRTEVVSPRSPKRYDDIGPIDDESGMPLAFRQVCHEQNKTNYEHCVNCYLKSSSFEFRFR